MFHSAFFAVFRSARLIFVHFDLFDIVICSLGECVERQMCGGILVGRDFFDGRLVVLGGEKNDEI